MQLQVVPLFRSGSPQWAELAALYRDHPPSSRLWITPHQLQATRVLAELVKQVPGVLSPGVKPLTQAAEALCAQSARPLKPASRVQQRRIVAEVVFQGARKRKYPLLKDAVTGAGGIDFVLRAFREFAHSNRSPEDLCDLADESSDRRGVEIARAFREYRQHLHKHELTDYELRLRLACELMEAGLPTPSTVFVTGIHAPTPLEMRLLHNLIDRAEHSLLELDLPPQHTSSEEASAHPWLGAEHLLRRLSATKPEPAPCDNGLRSQIRQKLFAGLTQSSAELLSDNSHQYSVIPARSSQREAAAIARQIKQRLLQGTQPEAMVVATRRLADFAPRLVEECEQVGVPLATELPKKLSDAPYARAIALVVRLARGDWRHAELLSVATLPHFRCFNQRMEEEEWKACRQAGFAHRRAATEWLLRELLYPKGQNELLRRVNWQAEEYARLTSAAPEEEDEEPTDRRRLKLALSGTLSLAALEALAQQCQAMLSPTTPTAWFDRLQTMVKELDYQSPPDALALDQAARLALEEAFSSLEKLDQWQHRDSLPLELEEVDSLLRDWLPRLPLDLPWRNEGHVLALTAETAAGLEPEHLFLAGLDEQSFPQPAADQVLPDEARTLRQQSEEMRLFLRLATCATHSTTFSFTQVDNKAQLLNPSSYLDELLRLFPTNALREEDDALTQPMSAGDLRTQATKSLLENQTEPLSAAFATAELRPSAQALAAGLRCTYARTSGDRFGPYEGQLVSSAAQSIVQQRYGPTHLWSASQLETYAECPFKYYLRHVLKADPLESLDLEVDYRRRGTLLHDAMVRLHRRLSELTGSDDAVSSIDPEPFLAAFDQAVRDALEAIAAAPHDQAVAEVEAMQATAWSEEYHRQCAKYEQKFDHCDQPLRPTHFEARFGPRVAAEESPDPLSTAEPFAFDLGDEQLLLTGQVDRIDVGRIGGQTVFTVIDYKTSKQMTVKEADIQSGRLLQMVLYTIAVTDHLMAQQDAHALGAGYWLVQNSGFKTGDTPQPGELQAGQIESPEAWRDLVACVRNRVREIVTDIRCGEFPVYNTKEDCTSGCEYHTVCRIGQARSVGKLPASSKEVPA